MEFLGHRFLNGIDGDAAFLHVDQVLQDLLRHVQIDGRPVSEE